MSSFSESQYDNFTPDDEVITKFVAEDPIDPVNPVVNVTNVSPYAPTHTSGTVMIPFWLLAILVCLSTMDLGLLYGVIR